MSAETGVKRILIITYKYVPMIAPRVFRWGAIVREWAGQGLGVDMICAANPGSKDFEIIEGANIYRIKPSGFVYKQRRRSLRAEKQAEAREKMSASRNRAPEGDGPSKGRRAGPMRILNRWAGTLYSRYSWPDNKMNWIIPAYRAARSLLQKHDYAGIVTVSFPISPHVVGWLLRRLIKKRNIRWIVDIGDPFSLNTLVPVNNVRVYKHLNRRFEKVLLAKASRVAVTNQWMKDVYRCVFRLEPDKIRVIPPLISVDKDSFSMGEPFFPKVPDKIRLVYAGSLRRKNRRPDGLLRLFAALKKRSLGDRLELHFFGNSRECEESFLAYRGWLGKSLFMHGLVAKENVDRALGEAGVLVNIGNRTSFQVPSKIADYLVLNKPLINIASREGDSSWEFLKETPMAMNVLQKDDKEWDEEVLASVEEFIRNPPRPLSAERLEALTGKFRPARIAEDYLTLIRGRDEFGNRGFR